MTPVDDARAMVTGFGSVLVQAGAVTTRGLFDDAESAVATGFGDAIVQTRALTLLAADVPNLAREDSVGVGTMVDDTDLTTYRVVDVRRMTDGVLLQVLVAA